MDYKLPKDTVMRLLNDGHRLVRCKSTDAGGATTWTINAAQVHHKTVESFIKQKMLSIIDTGDKYNGSSHRYAEFALKECLMEKE